MAPFRPPIRIPNAPFSAPGHPLGASGNRSAFLYSSPLANDRPHFNLHKASRSFLTPSCSRCRLKKLKCRFDSEDSGAACSNCVAKGLQHSCHRDLRTPRGRRRSKTSAALMNQRKNEIEALRRRLHQLESDSILVDWKEEEVDDDDDDKSAKQITPSGDTDLSRDEQTPSMRSKFGVNLQSELPQSESAGRRYGVSLGRLNTKEQSVAGILETFASQNSTHRKDMADNDPVHPNIFQILEQVKNCGVTRHKDLTQALLDAFVMRVNHNIGNVVHGPGISKALNALQIQESKELVSNKTFSEPVQVSVLLLVLCIGFDVFPVEPPPGVSADEGFLAVNALREKGIDPTIEWQKIALEGLAIEQNYQISSIAALQAACLILGRGVGNTGWLRMVELISIRSAQELGLHRLGHIDYIENVRKEDFIRLETSVRIWNYLSLRDWCGISHGSVGALDCMTNPDLTTTQLPLNIPDHDLDEGKFHNWPLSKWTNSTFTIVQLGLARIVREATYLGLLEEQCTSFKGTDVKHRFSSSGLSHMSKGSLQSIEKLLSQYIADLPPFYSIDNDANTSTGFIRVQRWQLHTQIFEFLLHLNRNTLSRSAIFFEETRTSFYAELGLMSPSGLMQRIAKRVIEQAPFVRRVCPVIDGFAIHYSQLYNACMVLVLDLICRHALSHSLEANYQRERASTRVQIQESLTNLRMSAKPFGSGVTGTIGPLSGSSAFDAQWRGAQILEKLMAFEDEIHSQVKSLSGVSKEILASRHELFLLANCIIMEAAEALRNTGNKKALDLSEVRPTNDESYFWPAMLLPTDQCRCTPSSTLLPAVGAWPFKASSCLVSDYNDEAFHQNRGISYGPWPHVSKSKDDKSGYKKLPSPLIQKASNRLISSAPETVKMVVIEWALSLQSISTKSASL